MDTQKNRKDKNIQELLATCAKQQNDIRNLEGQLAQLRSGQATLWVKIKRLIKRVGKAVIPVRFHPYAKQFIANLRQTTKNSSIQTSVVSQPANPKEMDLARQKKCRASNATEVEQLLLLCCQKEAEEHHSTWASQDGERHICFICKEDNVVPVLVAIASIKHNRDTLCHYVLHIVLSNVSSHWEKYFIFNNDSNFSIDLISCSDIPVPLLKFSLPQLLPCIDTVLYLDSDLIVCDDLHAIFACELNNTLAAYVPDTNSIDQEKQNDDTSSKDAFINTGVMLLNLKKAREDRLTEDLIAIQQSLPGQFVEQEAFSRALMGKTALFPLQFSSEALCENSQASKGASSNEGLTILYNSENDSDISDSHDKETCLILFSSKEKPWLSPLFPGSEQWHFYFTLSTFYDKRRSSLKGHKGEPVLCEILKKAQGQNQPKVSVIVPVYNTGPYLHGCIKSVLNQSLQDFELILIDDSSTDDSLDILTFYAKHDKRITLLRHKKNAGLSAVRNTGLSYAQGEYVQFLDSDDELTSDALEILYKKSKDDDLDVLRFSATSVYETMELEKNFPGYTRLYKIDKDYSLADGRHLFTKLVERKEYIVSACLCILRKNFLYQNKITFYDGIIHEDNIFTFEVLMNAKRACCINNKLYKRLVRECSIMTKQPTYKNYEGYLVTMCCLIRYLKDLSDADQKLYTAIKSKIYEYANSCRSIYKKLGVFDRYYLFWLEAGLRINSDLLLQKY